MDPDLYYNCIQFVLSLAGHKGIILGKVCDTGWHPEHMTGTGRLQARLKGNSN